MKAGKRRSGRAEESAEGGKKRPYWFDAILFFLSSFLANLKRSL